MTVAPVLAIGRVDVVPVEKAEGSVARWEANDAVVLRGYRAAGWGWIAVPGIAAFRFGESGEVVAVPDGASAELIEDTWLRSVLPLVVQARGTQVLHASAVSAAKGVVAFCGLSGAGKSTLAGALAKRGLTPVADDALPFETAAQGVTVLPLPFRMRLRAGSPDALGMPELGETRTAADAHSALAALVLLDPQSSAAGPELVPLSASDAFGALMPQAYCFSLEEGKEELVSAYLELVRRVPAFTLTYVQELDRLDEAVELLTYL